MTAASSTPPASRPSSEAGAESARTETARTETAPPDRVGRLRFEYGAPPEEEGDYRHRGAASVAIALDVPLMQAGRQQLAIVLLVALLSTGLTVFAVIVRTGPAIGTVSLAVGALMLLVVSSLRRAKPRAQRVSVDAMELKADGLAAFSADVGAVSRVGSGRGGGGGRTVWVEVEEVEEPGRVLLMDGLRDDEADAAVEVIQAAVERRRHVRGAAAPDAA